MNAEEPKLAQIRALCDEATRSTGMPVEGVVLSREEVDIVLGWKLVYGPNEDAAEAALESRLGAWLEEAK